MWTASWRDGFSIPTEAAAGSRRLPGQPIRPVDPPDTAERAMPNHQLEAIVLATAVWAIFAAAMTFWSPTPPADGIRMAEQQSRVAKTRGISRATASDLHR
jgi:hypothetical protein